MTTVHPQRVAVWKATWLPGSETFVRNQMNAMATWSPRAVGVKRINSSIAEPNDVVLWSDNLLGALARRVFVEVRWSSRLKRALSDVELVHSHFLSDAILVAPTTRRLGLPLVITVHGHDVTATLRGRRRIRRARDTLQLATRIIAVSEFTAAQVIRLGARPERVVVHHIGIPIPQPASDIEVPTYDAIFVGRLVEKKGVSDLLRAAQTAQRDLRRPFRLCIVGTGPLETSLIAEADDLDVHVDWQGHCTGAEVQALLRKSTMFVGASQRAKSGDSEGFGMVFLEAAAQGLPVVAYRHGGVPEAVLHGITGLLVDEGDVHALGQAMVDIASNADLGISLGAAGRERVASAFDISRQTQLLEVIYDQIAAESSDALK